MFAEKRESYPQKTIWKKAKHNQLGTPFVSLAAACDGDGNRVSAFIGNQTTLFVGGYYEMVLGTSAVTKYYMAGASRVAMNVNGVVYYLFSDQLGSTNLTVNASDNSVASEMRYGPWGDMR